MNNVFRLVNERNVFKKIGLFFRRLKWAWQRATKGFCDMDCADMDVWFLSVVPDMIKSIADSKQGVPDSFINDYYDKHKAEYSITFDEVKAGWFADDKEKERQYNEIVGKAKEEYAAVLNRMIFLFRESDPFKDGETAAERNEYEYIEKCKNEAFKLFSDHFYGLWV